MITTRASCIATLCSVWFYIGLLSVNAQQLYSLSWTANPESDVVGYRVHVGTASRQYTLSYPVNSNSIVISDLSVGPTYFFAVTAVNSVGLESAYSAEASSSGTPSGPIVTSALTTTAITISIQTLPNATVAFDASSDLRNWQFYTNKVANSQGLASLVEPRTSSRPSRFFRARTE